MNRVVEIIVRNVKAESANRFHYHLFELRFLVPQQYQSVQFLRRIFSEESEREFDYVIEASR